MKIKNLQTSALQLKKFLNKIPDDQLEYCRIVLQIPRYGLNRFVLSEVTTEEYEPDHKLVHITLISQA